RPNVGKSSLLNSLAQEKKAIVTNIPGTTRDVIEEYVNVRGVPLKLVDTAGIRETEDIVEKIGVERSREVLKNDDLIKLDIKYGETYESEEEALFKSVKDKETIIIVNKTDLQQKIDMDRVFELADHRPVISTSLLHEEGIDQLEEA